MVCAPERVSRLGRVLYGKEHVERYRATDGEEGHDWEGPRSRS